jgi:hypothetical protein
MKFLFRKNFKNDICYHKWYFGKTIEYDDSAKVINEKWSPHIDQFLIRKGSNCNFDPKEFVWNHELDNQKKYMTDYISFPNKFAESDTTEI